MACVITELNKELVRLMDTPQKKAAWGQYVNELTAIKQGAQQTSTKSTPISVVKIDSNQKGLEAALTNPTELAKSKGNLQQSYSIEYEGKQYEDVEKAFQELKDSSESVRKPAKEESGNYKLMVELIKTKLETYPRLVNAITKRGGLDYLNQTLHQPTNKNSVWETGGQDWFKSALIDAYSSVENEGFLAQPKQEQSNSIAAGEIYYDVEMSPEALVEVTTFNEKYVKDNKVKLEESDTFEYDPDTGVIKVDRLVPEEEYQTLLKHELLHHLSYENITKNLSEKVKDKLITEAENVRDYIEDKFGTTLEGNTAYQRLNYALEQVKSRGKDVQVAEIVAIVGAEKQIRDMLVNIADTRTLETLIRRLLNAVMELLGKDKKASESAKYVLDGVDQIIQESNRTLDTNKEIQGTIHLKDRAKIEAKYVDKLKEC